VNIKLHKGDKIAIRSSQRKIGERLELSATLIIVRVDIFCVSPTYQTIRHGDKIIEEVEGSESRKGGRNRGRENASSHLFFAVNASRSIPSRKRERDSTKPALFELSFASRRFFLFVFFQTNSRCSRPMRYRDRESALDATWIACPSFEPTLYVSIWLSA